MSRLLRHPFSPAGPFVVARSVFINEKQHWPGDRLDTAGLAPQLVRRLWDQRKIEAVDPNAAGGDVAGDAAPQPAPEVHSGQAGDEGAQQAPASDADPEEAPKPRKRQRKSEPAPEPDPEPTGEVVAFRKEVPPAASPPAVPAPTPEEGLLDFNDAPPQPALRAEHRGFGRWFVVDAEGGEQAGPVSKDEADAIVAKGAA